MKAKTMFVNERRDNLYFIRTVNRSVFGRLRDRNRGRLHGVIVAEACQMTRDPIAIDLPVAGWNSQ
jgi:hypothetical protein